MRISQLKALSKSLKNNSQASLQNRSLHSSSLCANLTRTTFKPSCKINAQASVKLHRNNFQASVQVSTSRSVSSETSNGHHESTIFTQSQSTRLQSTLNHNLYKTTVFQSFNLNLQTLALEPIQSLLNCNLDSTAIFTELQSSLNCNLHKTTAFPKSQSHFPDTRS